MNFFYLSKRALVFFLTILCLSCTSRKDIVYYQNSSIVPISSDQSYEIKIQPDDLLLIIVSAEDVEVAAPFNLNTVNIANTANPEIASGQQTLQQYLVDAKGNIDFPILGNLKVAGLSRTELLNLLREKIGVYIKNPIVNLRITNFKVSIQGEVITPGVYNVNSERITLLEAIAKAGDLTIYGKRNNILIIREVDGKKTFNRVDISSVDFMNSPFYYLTQNDVVYVEPNKTKVNGASVGSNTGIIISAISLLLTVVAIIVR